MNIALGKDHNSDVAMVKLMQYTMHVAHTLLVSVLAYRGVLGKHPTSA